VLTALLLSSHPGGEICTPAAYLTMVFLPTHFLTITYQEQKWAFSSLFGKENAHFHPNKSYSFENSDIQPEF
jgi:hypothetical protein